MFKLVVLSCVLSVAFAGIISHPVQYAAQVKTVVEPHFSVVETPTVNHVATVVKSIPSATSYQSQTQYHSKNIVEPIYAHGVQKSYINTPVVKQVVESVPVVQYAEPILAKAVYAPKALSYASPAVHYAAPAAYSAYAAPAHYAAAPVAYAAAPAHYSAAYAPAHYSSYSPYAHHY